LFGLGKKAPWEGARKTEKRKGGEKNWAGRGATLPVKGWGGEKIPETKSSGAKGGP